MFWVTGWARALKSERLVMKYGLRKLLRRRRKAGLRWVKLSTI